MPNGISPFNYRRLTPEQEARIERASKVVVACIFSIMGIAAVLRFFTLR